MSEWPLWLGDGLTLAAALLLTIAVFGMHRLPDPLLRLHSASKASAPGALVALAATAVTGDGPIIALATAVAVAITLTAPLSAHAIARAELATRDRPERP